MEDFAILARSLIAIGLTFLLIMLRLDAEKFGTAEYYEATADGFVQAATAEPLRGAPPPGTRAEGEARAAMAAEHGHAPSGGE